MVRFSKYVGSVRIQLILLKTKNQKCRSKIIFEWENNAVGPIFNIFFFWIKWLLALWTVHFVSCTVYHVHEQYSHCSYMLKKKKKKKKEGNAKLKTQTCSRPISDGHVVMLIFFNGSCSLSLQPSLKPNFVNFLKWTINKCLKSFH